MIDGIRITIYKKDFDSLKGNFDNCKLVTKKQLIDDIPDNRKKRDEIKYHLPNPNNNHNLGVSIYDNKYIKIYGSLRKWFYGKTNLNDLTQEKFSQVIKKIAEQLNIPYSFLLEAARITKIEIGYNIPTKVDCKTIIPSIHCYGKLKEYINYHGKNETHYSLGFDKKLRIYNKSKELMDKYKVKIDQIITRIEVEMKDTLSFEHYRLGKLKSLSDIYREWENLQLFFLNEISRLRMITPISLESHYSKKELAMKKYLLRNGFEKGIKKYSKKYRKDIKKVERDFLNLIAMHAASETYSLGSLKKDVLKRFVVINKEDKNIPKNWIAHFLWGTKYSKVLKTALYNKGKLSA